MTMGEMTVNRTERQSALTSAPENIQNDDINGAVRNNKTQKLTLYIKFTGKLKHSLSQQIQMYYGSGTVAQRIQRANDGGLTAAH